MSTTTGRITGIPLSSKGASRLQQLEAEVLELRAALSAAAPAMAAMHSCAKAVFDDYELTIDHFGDLAARQAERIAALEAELATAREGRDYGC